MILSCNSCEKKFVVPDQAITTSGRMVQCGSCGNKWKQFPIKNETNKINTSQKVRKKRIITAPKLKKKKIKKTREINLYSPEYLEKKHGIKLGEVKIKNVAESNKKISFGFYNSLLIFFVFIIAFSKGLHFFQDIIIQKIPITEFYLDYFFENIINIFEIWKNLISN
jgi:predicted Zn finger-like uncharacterized protein|tara:strand:- start:126 stop:626 length:501 start_codon:yes stop_codon:yes gene_type:complete